MNDIIPDDKRTLYEDEEETLYSRHTGVKMLVPEEAFVVGCGGTGTWVAIILSMIGTKRIHLSDSDILELHNLNRLPYKVTEIGKNKATSLKNYIHEIRPNCEIITYDGIYNDTGLFQLTSNLVFDCTDDSKTQGILYTYCKDHKKRYVRVGCNADHVTVLGDLEGLWGDGEQRYQVTPISIISPIFASLVAVWHVVNNKYNIDYLKNISDIFKSTSIVTGKVCNECPLKDTCNPCGEHKTSQYEICSHCPISLT